MRKLLFLIGGMAMTTVYAESLVLTSHSMQNNVKIPMQYTCDGRDSSPQLSWSGAPANTKSFVLILVDLDAPGGNFYHWVLYNMPKGTTQLSEGVTSLPVGTLIGKNSFGNDRYNGPCPPRGPAHRYIFNVYALDSELSLAAGEEAETVLDAIQSHVIASGTFNASYNR